MTPNHDWDDSAPTPGERAAPTPGAVFVAETPGDAARDFVESLIIDYEHFAAMYRKDAANASFAPVRRAKAEQYATDRTHMADLMRDVLARLDASMPGAAPQGTTMYAVVRVSDGVVVGASAQSFTLAVHDAAPKIGWHAATDLFSGIPTDESCEGFESSGYRLARRAVAL